MQLSSVSKRAKVMFSQASVCSSRGGGAVTPNASWDRSQGEVVWPGEMEITTTPPGQDHLHRREAKVINISPAQAHLPPLSRGIKGHWPPTPPVSKGHWPATTPPPPTYGHYGQAVRVIRECILVGFILLSSEAIQKCQHYQLCLSRENSTKYILP